MAASADQPRATGVPWYSWGAVAIAAIGAGLGALWVALTPTADQTDLDGRTWQQFAQQDPEVANLYSMDLRILGLLGAGFGVLAAVISVVPYRRGERWAWYALWSFPITIGAVAVRMLVDRYSATFVYAAFAAVAVVGLLFPARRFLRPGRGHSGSQRQGQDRG